MMSITILSTKLNLPPANQNLVRRQRLLSLLDEGLQGSRLLTLVCAPTGYGKTTLVSQWIHDIINRKSGTPSAAQQFIWLSLDQEDNDLARFISYFIAAVQQVQQDFGRSAVATLQNIRSTSPNLLATLLINDLVTLANPTLLVLEDYQVINSQAIHDFMSYLIDHQPAHFHWVIITRADPPLPLARLRAKGKLIEIRLHDLAMTETEAREFLVELMELDLSTEQAQLLKERTEGWIAGLQLAALSMRHADTIPAFIQDFSGRHEYIADYLTGEVLEQLDGETKDFLLQTSILRRLSAPLCEAVTGLPQAGHILEKLATNNTFLISLDDQRQWYRYHALFADLLQKRLRQFNKDIPESLHHKAGVWYAKNNMLDQAIEHFLAGEVFDRAATLIGANVEQILMAGQTATYLRWLETFPQDQLQAYPVLIVYQGVAMMLLGRIPENALSMLQGISAPAGKFQGETDTLEALHLVLKGNAPEAIRVAESALKNLPAERTFLRILAADSLAMGHTLRGDLINATLAFEKVVEASKIAGNTIMMLIGLSNLAGLHYQQGQLHQAWDDYQMVLDLSRERLGGRSQPMGRALFGMGEVAREWNDLANARKYLSEAEEIFKQFVDIGLAVVYVSLARVYLSQGEFEEVPSILAAARKHSRESKATLLDDNLTELMQARLWISLGELEKAGQWARQRGLTEKPTGDLATLADRNATAFELIQGEYLTLVRLYLAECESQKALDVLDVIRSHNENRSQMRRVVEVLVLQAIAYQQLGLHEQAMQAFTRALTLAEPENYVRTFLDEGQPVARLLSQAIASDQSLAYARDLLTALTGQGAPVQLTEKKAVSTKSLVEPLSIRELEVLGLITQGMTNQEIGLHLHISLSTVKGHTSNIYGKLGVKNRTQAIALAQELGLLRHN